MALTATQLRIDYRARLLNEMESYYRGKYGPDWKRVWANVVTNPEWLDNDYVNIDREVKYAWNPWDTAQSIEQRVYNDFGGPESVNIKSITYEYIAPRHYWIIILDVYNTSPLYYGKNYRLEIVDVSSLEQLLEEYSQANNIDLIEYELIERTRVNFTWGYRYKVLYRLLPGHSEFVYKYSANFTRKWATDTNLPIFSSPDPEDWLIFDTDADLDAYLAENVPGNHTGDMWKTLDAIAEVLSYQLVKAYTPESYVLMPLYLDNGPENTLQAYSQNQKNPEEGRIPLVELGIDNYRKGPKSLYPATVGPGSSLYEGFWNTGWYIESVPNIQQYGIPHNEAISKRDIITNIVEKSLLRMGIFSLDYDYNDLFTPSQRNDLISAGIYHPNKLEWLVHLFDERLGAPQEPDPGNTHSTAKYGLEEGESNIIRSIVSENVKNTYIRATTEFQKSDTVENSYITIDKKIALATDLITRGYGGPYVSDIKVAIIAENLSFDVELRRNPDFNKAEQPYELIIKNNLNYSIPIGEPISLFNENNEILVDVREIRLRMEAAIEAEYVGNLGLAIGDRIFHISAIEANEITILDYNNEFSSVDVGAKCAILRYWATSVPGEPIQNPFIGKKIQLQDMPSIVWWDGVENTVKNYGYWYRQFGGGWRLAPYSQWEWLEDLLSIIQNTYNHILSDFALRAAITVNSVDIMSEYDDDWGIISDATFEVEI